MKKRIFFLTGTVLLLILAVAGLTFVPGKAEPRLTLRLSSEKTNYKLGEPITFNFELTNGSGKQVELLDGFDIASSSISLEVSLDGKPYARCGDSGWGTLDASLQSPLNLPPDQSLETSGSMLWKRSAKDTPEFFFTRSGSLSFRAKYVALLLSDGKRMEIPLESEPIQITLESPSGEDLEVWNKIKDDGNFALLIQKNRVDISDSKTEERAKFMQKVEDIIGTHPNSFYAESLHQSKAKFEAAEIARQEMIKKMQIQ